MSSLCARALGLSTSVVTARLLGRENFGRFGMIVASVSLFSVYAGLGMGVTATKYVSQYRRTEPDRAVELFGAAFRLALIASAALALSVLIGSKFIAETALGMPSLAPLVRVSALLVLLNGINGVQAGGLAGFEAFREIAVVNLQAGLVGMPVTALLTAQYGLTGALAGMVTTLLITALLNARALHRHSPKIYGWRAGAKWREVLHFGTPVLMASLVSTPASYFLNAILVRQPSGYSAMAVVSSAEQWRQIINYIPFTLASAFVPVLSSMRHESATTAVRVAFYQVGFSGLIATAIAVPVALNANLILNVYGKGFESGKTTFVILTLTTIIIALANSFSLGLQALGMPWLECTTHVLWGVSLVAFGLVLIPRFQSRGYALAILSATTIQILWQLLVAAFVLIPRAFANPTLRPRAAPIELPS